ncbi:fumarate lyase [Desulfobulbus propionicus DSM 2032]|uniref:Fumarate lyase n=1 Tax=Desulfobulbus propionicus (strain ATCC 33891 / DSM 2032 / VKM B-1956 / 1pr3) TaxID=577650 RepID=A0A7U4DP76_DESPD|nr:aspartate ammonia-lyase [Desulfobulbus propionicus]ADW17754.1 fumarate lyase [Desulfobulbus propionicus DSM 2032]
MATTRPETDSLGTREVPAAPLWGIHTLRALENFPLTGRPIHPLLVRSLGLVKLAAAQTNHRLGAWSDDDDKASAILAACTEMAEGGLGSAIVVDALQGGAGTSANMNVNEVLANRALELLGCGRGEYTRVNPLDDLNLHQSTNDVFPTALKIAALLSLDRLEQRVVALQEALQEQEQRWAHVVKVGRTEMQDAVLITVGRGFGAYAEAINRDRWRISKCRERLRVVNLGGTAVGTGLAAPRRYIFEVTEALRQLTGLSLARAENLVEATQNVDVFVEVSGILKAHAASLLKICTDLRLLSSGPDAGLAEIRLPARQAGSSIMPGKVNPVIPEAVSQAAMLVIGNDTTLTLACASGSLELNPFLPLVALTLLDNLDLLAQADDILCRHCIVGIKVDEARCARQVENSTASATALLPAIGHERAAEIARKAAHTGTSVRELAREAGISDVQFDQLTSATAVCRLGFVPPSTEKR